MSRYQYLSAEETPLAIMLTAYAAFVYVGMAPQQPPAEWDYSTDPSLSESKPEPTLVIDAKTKNWIKFQRLVDQWRSERGAMSSITEMSVLPSYQTIIGMGEEAVPLILVQLKSEGDDPDQWFWALRAITAANPIKPEDQGNFRKMAQAWLKWAEDEGYAW
jgi:hypothetical protein